MVKLSPAGKFWLCYFIILGLCFFLLSKALAFTVTLNWEANEEPDLAKYTIYHNGQKLAEKVKDPTTGVIPTSHTHENVSSGIHTYWLTATDTSNNESGRSNAAVQPLVNWTVTITQ